MASPSDDRPASPADPPQDAIAELFQQGHFRDVVPLARKVLAAHEAELGPGHPELAHHLNRLGVVLHESGEFAEARVPFERALAILERSPGNNDSARAQVLGNLGDLLADMGEAEVARDLLEEAVAVLEVVEEPGDALALALNSLGVHLRREGDIEGARQRFERALALYAEFVGTDHPDYAMALANLGSVYQDLGDLNEARTLTEQVLRIYEAAHSPGHRDIGITVGSLAVLVHAQGDYAGARLLYERALQILLDAVGPDGREAADVLHDLGRLLHDQGDLVEARAFYHRALDIRERVYGADHWVVAGSLDTLAVLLDDSERFAEARPLYERALKIREASFGPDHPDVAMTLTNYAVLLDHLDDHAAARQRYERAHSIYHAALGPDHPDTAMALHNLGTSYEETGDYEEAAALYVRALELWEAALGAGHPDVALCLRNLATLRWMQGDRDAARAFLLRAAGALDLHAAGVLPALAPAEQRAFVDVALGHLAGPLLSLAEHPAALAETYAMLAGWKGVLLDGLRHQAAIAAMAGHPQYGDSVAELQASRARVAHAYHTGASPEVLAAYEAEREQLERALARALPPGVVNDWRGVDALAAALPLDAAFVDVYHYLRWEDGEPAAWRYGAVVLTSPGPPTLVDIGTAREVDDAVEAWRSGCELDFDGAYTRHFAEQVWGSVAAALPPGVARVWVAPDGALTRVPWSVLAEVHAGGRELDPLVLQVSSARALFRLLGEHQDLAPGALLVVSDVDFGPEREWGSPEWPELPGTAAEGLAIADVAGAAGLTVRMLERASATPAAVARAAQEAAYVHVATHGFFGGWTRAEYRARQSAALRSGPGWGPLPGGRSPLAASGLALAGANTGPHGNLSAEEIVGLRLEGARLVVLSACDTARGAEVTGQGVLGLQAAVQAAGARALLMSLWPISDVATVVLMEMFYRGIWEDALSPAEALRRAQAAVRQEPGWRSPDFWAGWALLGDGFRPVVAANSTRPDSHPETALSGA